MKGSVDRRGDLRIINPKKSAASRQAAYRAKNEPLKHAEGLCKVGKCPHPARPDGVRCIEHTRRENEGHARRRRNARLEKATAAMSGKRLTVRAAELAVIAIVEWIRDGRDVPKPAIERAVDALREARAKRKRNGWS